MNTWDGVKATQRIWDGADAGFEVKVTAIGLTSRSLRDRVRAIMAETEEQLIVAWDEEDKRQRKASEELDKVTNLTKDVADVTRALGGVEALIGAMAGGGWPKAPGAEQQKDPGPPVGDSRP